MNTVEVRDLTVRYRGRRIVGPVSFALANGAALGLCGPSGSGKSTVLRALVGLVSPELRVQGDLVVLGSPSRTPAWLTELRSRAVLVGQVPIVFPGSILANALFGLRHVVRGPKEALRSRAIDALREAGLWDEVVDRLDEPAGKLSVGQQQRLCLARALALDPVLLLLDEPTSALDTASRGVVEDTIGRLRGRRTILLVSHDPQQVVRLCDGVVDLPPQEPGPSDGRRLQRPQAIDLAALNLDRPHLTTSLQKGAKPWT